MNKISCVIYEFILILCSYMLLKIESIIYYFTLNKCINTAHVFCGRSTLFFFFFF